MLYLHSFIISVIFVNLNSPESEISKESLGSNLFLISENRIGFKISFLNLS